MALLHLAPQLGEITQNRQLLETAVHRAAELGADWIITPELWVCGYLFAERIGTDWILPSPDPWMTHFCQMVARLQVTVFLSYPERDPQTDRLYNTVFVIAADGTCLGTHRKSMSYRRPKAGPVLATVWYRSPCLPCRSAC
jgi:N-carbamoylputrescine amidase